MGGGIHLHGQGAGRRLGLGAADMKVLNWDAASRRFERLAAPA
jgi:hypothetical protein